MVRGTQGTNPLPVTKGSPRFDSMEVGAFRVEEARFAPDLELPRHVHERAVVAVFLEGAMELSICGATLECRPSTILVEPRGEPHAQRFMRTGAHILIIQPDPERMDEVGPGREVFERVHCFPNGRVALAARELRREMAAVDDVAPLARHSLIYEIVATATRVARHRDMRSSPPAWLKTVRELIHDRFQDSLRIADFAEAVDLHPAHVARVFRKHHRVSIGEYIRMLRLDWAARQLSKSEEPLSAIAVRAGYADQSHFTRVFKRHTGLTPAQYRELRAGSRN